MEKIAGCDELRQIVRNMDATTESFNQQFSAVQLVQIGRMLLASQWDILPDQWNERQVREALLGFPPHWDDQEKPVYVGREGYPHRRHRAAKEGGP